MESQTYQNCAEFHPTHATHDKGGLEMPSELRSCEVESRRGPKIMLKYKADVSRMLRIVKESESLVVFKWAFFMKIAMVILQVIT